jgi:hypothetical protein
MFLISYACSIEPISISSLFQVIKFVKTLHFQFLLSVISAVFLLCTLAIAYSV